jgi:hypothetical protein
MRTQTNVEWILRTFREAAWAPLLVLALFLAGAGLFDAYTHFPPLDKPTHFFGGLAVTYFFWCGWGQASSPAAYLPRVSQAAFAFGCTAVTALIWEIFEFLSDRFLATHMQHGPEDTLSDVFFGLAGAVVYLLMRRSRAASAGAPALPEPPDEGV